MLLYRGTGGYERKRRLYGFSWTNSLEIARNFAGHWAAAEGGVILETVAPANAVLLVRKPENYYDEGEVVVDPFRLGPVLVKERFASTFPIEVAQAVESGDATAC